MLIVFWCFNVVSPKLWESSLMRIQGWQKFFDLWLTESALAHAVHKSVCRTGCCSEPPFPCIQFNLQPGICLASPGFIRLHGLHDVSCAAQTSATTNVLSSVLSQQRPQGVSLWRRINLVKSSVTSGPGPPARLVGWHGLEIASAGLLKYWVINVTQSCVLSVSILVEACQSSLGASHAGSDHLRTESLSQVVETTERSCYKTYKVAMT